MTAQCIYMDIASEAVPAQGATLVTDRYFAAWAETHHAPIALLSRDQHLLWANDAAMALFTAGEHLVIKDGVLTSIDKVQAPRIRAFFEQLTHVSDGRICKSAEGVSLILRAHILTLKDGSSAIALSMFSTEPGGRFIWTDFGEAFKLTRSEVEVAKRILDGAIADEVAEDLNVSVETVRSHIRSLYGKLSINSRERLFAVISPYRIG